MAVTIYIIDKKGKFFPLMFYEGETELTVGTLRAHFLTQKRNESERNKMSMRLNNEICGCTKIPLSQHL